MDYTPRESTVPNEHQLEQMAQRYSEMHPDGPPPKSHPLKRLLKRVLPERDDSRPRSPGEGAKG